MCRWLSPDSEAGAATCESLGTKRKTMLDVDDRSSKKLASTRSDGAAEHTLIQALTSQAFGSCLVGDTNLVSCVRKLV